jgi:hypothetical protein
MLFYFIVPPCIDTHLFVEYKCRRINFTMKNALTSRDGSRAPIKTITHRRSWYSILETYEINGSFWTENQSKNVFFMQEDSSRFLKRSS